MNPDSSLSSFTLLTLHDLLSQILNTDSTYREIELSAAVLSLNRPSSLKMADCLEEVVSCAAKVGDAEARRQLFVFLNSLPGDAEAGVEALRGLREALDMAVEAINKEIHPKTDPDKEDPQLVDEIKENPPQPDEIKEDPELIDDVSDATSNSSINPPLSNSDSSPSSQGPQIDAFDAVCSAAPSAHPPLSAAAAAAALAGCEALALVSRCFAGDSLWSWLAEGESSLPLIASAVYHLPPSPPRTSGLSSLFAFLGALGDESSAGGSHCEQLASQLSIALDAAGLFFTVAAINAGASAPALRTAAAPRRILALVEAGLVGSRRFDAALLAARAFEPRALKLLAAEGDPGRLFALFLRLLEPREFDAAAEVAMAAAANFALGLGPRLPRSLATAAVRPAAETLRRALTEETGMVRAAARVVRLVAEAAGSAGLGFETLVVALCKELEKKEGVIDPEMVRLLAELAEIEWGREAGGKKKAGELKKKGKKGECRKYSEDKLDDRNGDRRIDREEAPYGHNDLKVDQRILTDLQEDSSTPTDLQGPANPKDSLLIDSNTDPSYVFPSSFQFPSNITPHHHFSEPLISSQSSPIFLSRLFEYLSQTIERRASPEIVSASLNLLFEVFEDSKFNRLFEEKKTLCVLRVLEIRLPQVAQKLEGETQMYVLDTAFNLSRFIKHKQSQGVFE